ncbi:hypothetical protein L204_106363 [Cryptococcus depauperatus]
MPSSSFYPAVYRLTQGQASALALLGFSFQERYSECASRIPDASDSPQVFDPNSEFFFFSLSSFFFLSNNLLPSHSLYRHPGSSLDAYVPGFHSLDTPDRQDCFSQHPLHRYKTLTNSSL